MLANKLLFESSKELVIYASHSQGLDAKGGRVDAPDSIVLEVTNTYSEKQYHQRPHFTQSHQRLIHKTFRTTETEHDDLRANNSYCPFTNGCESGLKRSYCHQSVVTQTRKCPVTFSCCSLLQISYGTQVASHTVGSLYQIKARHSFLWC